MATRGAYAKGRERREAILRATLELFSIAGYRGTSFRAIAAELGITPTLIQHYFHSREELLTEIIRAWDAQNASAADGQAPLEAFVGNIRRNAEIPGLIRLYTAYSVEASDPHHPARAFFKARYDLMTKALADDIRTKRTAGDAPEGLEPISTARLLIATCEGLQVRWLHSPEFDLYDAFVTELVDLGIEPYRSGPRPVTDPNGTHLTTAATLPN